MRADNNIDLSGADGEKMQKLLDILEDLDDTQDVFHNAAISE
jgi:transcriptional/translational regulatory protein YebC/TACO1